MKTIGDPDGNGPMGETVEEEAPPPPAIRQNKKKESGWIRIHLEEKTVESGTTQPPIDAEERANREPESNEEPAN